MIMNPTQWPECPICTECFTEGIHSIREPIRTCQSELHAVCISCWNVIYSKNMLKCPIYPCQAELNNKGS